MNATRTILFWLLAAAPALAQQDARVSAGGDKGILQWVIALVIILLASAIAFMNPKRSHLD